MPASAAGKVPGNYFADWSSQSSVSSDILTGEQVSHDYGYDGYDVVGTLDCSNHLMDRPQM